MAVAYDTTAGNSIVSIGPYPQTCTASIATSGVNRLLIAHVTWINVVGGTFSIGGEYLESVKYNSADMTFLFENSASAVSNSFYYTVAPETSSKSVVATWNSTDFPDSIVITGSLGLASFNGVNQSNPISQSGNATGSTSPITKSLTTSSIENMLVDGACSYRSTSASTVTVGAGQDQRRSNLVGSSGARHYELISTKQATAGADTMFWTQSVNRQWATIVAELAAFVPTIGASPSQMLAGHP